MFDERVTLIFPQCEYEVMHITKAEAEEWLDEIIDIVTDERIPKVDRLKMVIDAISD